MAWLRIGDDVITHPYMARLLEVCDFNQTLRAEAFTTLVLLATASASHLTDGLLNMGTLSMVIPGREKAVLDVLVEAGLAERVKGDNGRWLIQLTCNDEEFVHYRSRQEVMIDRNRAADKRRPHLQIPIRVRDGDQCRWCGKTVSWKNRNGNRAATVDSLTDHVDSTVDTLVIACGECNTRRRNETSYKPELLPPPTDPYYSEHTANFVNKNPWSIDHGIHIEASKGDPKQTSLPIPNIDQSAQAADGQGRSSANSAARPGNGARTGAARILQDFDRLEDAPDWALEGIAMQAADGQGRSSANSAARPGNGAPQQSGTSMRGASQPPESRPSLEREGDVSRRVGSGREGKGSKGQDRAVSAHGKESAQPRKRRPRRGKRGRRKRHDK